MILENWNTGLLDLLKTIDFLKLLDIIQPMKNITNTLSQSKINVDYLLEDYSLDFSLFTELDDRLLAIQDKWEHLKETDKIILYLYAEYGSLRKVASLLGFSHSTIAKYLKEIREKLC